MSAIVIRDSDGRVFYAGDSIIVQSDRYVVTRNGHTEDVLKTFLSLSTSVVSGVTVPDDLQPGFNYNYDAMSGNLVSSGESKPSPAPVVPAFWADCADIPRQEFIPLAVQALSPAGYARIRNDTNGSWVFDTIMSSDKIAPNSVNDAGRNLFDDLLNYLLTTDADSDGQKLLLPAGRNALHAAWRKK